MKSLTIKIMEKELNIAEILKDKPRNTKLYSLVYGECKLNKVGVYGMFSVICDGAIRDIKENGKIFDAGECTIYPSKQMRDWSKFAWKKGDVLTDEERFVIFECFDNDEYTEFSAPFEYNDSTFRRDLGLIVDDFRKVSDGVAQEVIKKIEEHYGGKLNLDTLKIEKSQFKDGNIVVLDETEDKFYAKCILILKAIDEENAEYSYYAFINTTDDCTRFNYKAFHEGKLRLATEEEKQQLFAALEKDGKAWDAEKKAIVDLPKKCEFKPMDLCLMRFRGTNKDVWKLCQFGFIDCKDKNDFGYCAIGGNWFDECIPYNDQTAHLLGTTDDWKEVRDDEGKN